jgi:DNA-binding NtrC family response regulator
LNNSKNNNIIITTNALDATTKNPQETKEFYLNTLYRTTRSSTAQKAKLDIGKAASKTMMIQVIDDEFDIVTVTKLFLQYIGLNAFGFTDPLLALKHFSINCEKYSLVISDISMPSINGYEYVKQVKKINPKVKVILMSAFEFEDIELPNVLPELNIDAFVQKPFSNFKLEQIIEKCLSVGNIT